MRVNVVCRNWQDDRVLPRFARHLAERNGWALNKGAIPGYDLNYYMAYFEHQKNPHFTDRRAAYFTHYEHGAKAELYDNVAARVWLRVAMNKGQIAHLKNFGKSYTVPLPLELEHFKLSGVRARGIAGFSGYTYKSGRKGESLANRLVRDFGTIQFKASGRGWPCPTKLYQWNDMPAFFQSIDVYVCTSELEGGPMTTLEALATGRPVVIPDTVGIHPQLPQAHGIYRYKTGDYASLKQAFNQAVDELGSHDPKALRQATHPHSIKAFTEGTLRLFENQLYNKGHISPQPPHQDKCGIYVVAFGDPARHCARDCIRSIHKHMPDIPVALCSDRELGPENILITQPDRDIGGRIAKLKAFDLAPAEWQYVLYVDEDTEIVADVSFFFQLLQDGWEFVICKDAHLHDTMRHFQRSNNKVEYQQTINELGTDESLQINGGVWAFRRNDRTRRYFERLYKEWAKYKGRDQGAMIRALYADPLRVFWLCNEWNTLVTLKGKEYPPRIKGTAGIIHWVGKARRWEGQVPRGKGLTDPEAWQMVQAWERKHGVKNKSR